MPKKVIVSGISGQDGSYMADFLIANTDHEIFGMIRHSSNPNKKNYQHLLNNPRFKIVSADLTDLVSISYIVDKIKPDYFINFGAQSFVYESWNTPVSTFEIDAMGPLHCLEAIRKYAPNCRFYSAGSSEEVGDVDYSPQDLKHPLKPRSPYGAAKCAAKMITKVYRESYNLYALHGRLYNHESERRGEAFVTRKITKGVARIYHSIKNGKDFEPIELGNLDAKRDWSHAYDFVDGIWRMMNQELYNKDIIQLANKTEKLDQGLKFLSYVDYNYFIKNGLKEYVLSSNETHSVRKFVELAFAAANLKIDKVDNGGALPVLEGKGRQIQYIYNKKPVVVINPVFFRPAEVSILLGDSTEIRKELGWKPQISFNQLVERMVKHDIENYGN